MSDMAGTYGSNLALHLVNAIDYTAPVAVYAGLWTALPGANTPGPGEVSGGGYARQLITAKMNFASTPPTHRENHLVIDFGIASSDWGDVGWIALIGHLTDASPYFARTALAESADITSGQQALFPLRALDMTWA